MAAFKVILVVARNNLEAEREAIYGPRPSRRRLTCVPPGPIFQTPETKRYGLSTMD